MINLDKLILDPDERATTSHDEIISWVERHNGKPEVFDEVMAGADKTGIRIDFSGEQDEKYMNESVEQRTVSWQKFFQIFDKQGLAFIYQVEPKAKDKSMTYKFIKKENIDWDSISS